jgi:hypothetical protein
MGHIRLGRLPKTLRWQGVLQLLDQTPSKAVAQRYFRDAIEAVLAGAAPAASETPPCGCTIKWR